MIYGYLVEKNALVRALLVLAAVPIAVVANSLLIVGTGALVQFWNPDKAAGFFHAFSGWIVFVVSLVLLVSCHRLLTITLPKVARGSLRTVRET